MVPLQWLWRKRWTCTGCTDPSVFNCSVCQQRQTGTEGKRGQRSGRMEVGRSIYGWRRAAQEAVQAQEEDWDWPQKCSPDPNHHPIPNESYICCLDLDLQNNRHRTEKFLRAVWAFPGVKGIKIPLLQLALQLQPISFWTQHMPISLSTPVWVRIVQ